MSTPTSVQPPPYSSGFHRDVLAAFPDNTVVAELLAGNHRDLVGYLAGSASPSEALCRRAFAGDPHAMQEAGNMQRNRDLLVGLHRRWLDQERGWERPWRPTSDR